MAQFTLPKPVGGKARNGFDLSQRHIFSSKCGQLLPVLALEVVPTDHIELDVSSFLRTMPVQTAAYSRMKHNLDFVFIPFRSLWSGFDQFIAQRPDFRDTLQDKLWDGEVAQYVPRMHCEELHTIFNATDNILDDAGFPICFDMIRLLDLLGYCNISSSGNLSEQISFARTVLAEFGRKNISFNMFRLLAYHKAFDAFYRNPVRDLRNWTYTYNVNDYSSGKFLTVFRTSGTVATQENLFNMFSLHYVSKKRDMFTGSYPNAQFGPVSSIMSETDFQTMLGISLSGVQASGDNPLIVQNITSASTPLEVRTGPTRMKFKFDGNQQQFDIPELRKAYALQHLRENLLRAGNRTSSIFASKFGTNGRSMLYDDATMLASFDSNVVIDEVTNVAGGSVDLGELGGKGTSVNHTNRFTFDCPNDTYGIILGLSYIRPENEYQSFGIDRANMSVEPYDFFTPELQDLGFTPVHTCERNAAILLNEQLDAQKVDGYLPPYYWHKTAVDKVHGRFCDQLSPDGVDAHNPGSFRHWVSPTTFDIVSNLEDIPAKDFYVHPQQLDRIFYNASDESQDTDQFLHTVYFDIKAVRPMSLLGL